MRRFKQQLPDSEVARILNEGTVAVLAVTDADGYPYAVPVNYVCADGSIYIHSAGAGHKVDALRHEPRCSVCIVDRDDVVPEEFTSYFRSVIAFGRAVIVDDEADKVRALVRLCDKYSPGIDPTAEIARFIKTVCIIRIDIDSVTGKEAIELVRNR